METNVSPASQIANNAVQTISVILVNPVRNAMLMEVTVSLVTSMTASSALK